VHILISMMEMKLVYMDKLDISKKVYASAQYGVNGGYGAVTRNVQILDIMLELITVSTYKTIVGGKGNRQYRAKRWHLIQKIRVSKDAITGLYKIRNRRELHYEPFRNWTLELNAMAADKLYVHATVNRKYDVEMRYRIRTRESSAAIYRAYGRWLSRVNLYVTCLILELKKFFYRTLKCKRSL
jgi:hypothetical protein